MNTRVIKNTILYYLVTYRQLIPLLPVLIALTVTPIVHAQECPLPIGCVEASRLIMLIRILNLLVLGAIFIMVGMAVFFYFLGALGPVFERIGMMMIERITFILGLLLFYVAMLMNLDKGVVTIPGTNYATFDMACLVYHGPYLFQVLGRLLMLFGVKFEYLYGEEYCGNVGY